MFDERQEYARKVARCIGRDVDRAAMVVIVVGALAAVGFVWLLLLTMGAFAP